MMSGTISWSEAKTIALKCRARLFEEVLNLNFDSLPYLGHLVTKTAIEAGYVPKRQNLKGHTLQEWSRATSFEGRGAPNQWACLAAVDLLLKHGSEPPAIDDELLTAMIYYWYTAHGPFEDVASALAALPAHWHLPSVEALLRCAVKSAES